MAVGKLSNVGGSKSLPESMRAKVVKAFEELIGDKFKDDDGKQWSQTKIGEAMAVDGVIAKMSQSLVSDIRSGKKIGPQFLIALSYHSGKTINEILGPPIEHVAAPTGELAGFAAEAIYAAIAFIEIIDEKGFAYSGPPGFRYHAMRDAVRIVQNKARIETQIATSASLAIDKIRRASNAFTDAAERTARAGRAADGAVARFLKRAG